MAVTIKKLDGSTVKPSGAHFKRLGMIRANLRKGYQVEYAPYPNENGSWLVRLVRPRRGVVSNAQVDSYFQIVAKNQDEAEAFILKNELWGGALAERIAARIGKRGEVHAINQMNAGTRMVDSVTGKGMTFRNIKQYQNRSDNGLDMLAQIRTVDPPPPPSAGDFVAFEVKSTLGALDNPPGLSRAQKNPGRNNGFVETRLKRALEGSGSYPALSDADLDFIEDALSALEDSAMHFRKIGIRMDHSGALASTGGKPAMEMTAWQ